LLKKTGKVAQKVAQAKSSALPGPSFMPEAPQKGHPQAGRAGDTFRRNSVA